MVIKTISVQEKKTVEERRDNRLILGSLIVFGLGFFALLLGMIFTVVHAVVVHDTVFELLSTILLAATFPLLFIGSHLLDVERTRRRTRRGKELENNLKL